VTTQLKLTNISNKNKIVTMSDAFKTAAKFIILLFDRIFIPPQHIYV